MPADENFLQQFPAALHGVRLDAVWQPAQGR
jgi:hypothetical protein